ncbi:uncharacterized protein LOC128955180 [Oppia nitens]|uniref:uncharacterized protein LOC128955180 n=1 Tax=Oppia nitens TaxID=1686743 RepID=UPI0023DA5914|nr:uncharacterized protein LOC128955180 [Oppia nitens]
MFALAVNKLGNCIRNPAKWMTRFSSATAKCIAMASNQMSGQSCSPPLSLGQPFDDNDLPMDVSHDESIDNNGGVKRRRLNSGLQQNECNRCLKLLDEITSLKTQIKCYSDEANRCHHRLNNFGDKFSNFIGDIGPDLFGDRWEQIISNSNHLDEDNNLEDFVDSVNSVNSVQSPGSGSFEAANDGDLVDEDPLAEVTLNGTVWCNNHENKIDRRLNLVSPYNRAIKLGVNWGLNFDIINESEGYLTSISLRNLKIIQLYGHMVNGGKMKDNVTVFEVYQKASYMGTKTHKNGNTIHLIAFCRQWSPCCAICGQCLDTGVKQASTNDIHNHMNVKHHIMDNPTQKISAKFQIIS